MTQAIALTIDDRPLAVRAGTSVAAAVELAMPGRGAHVSPGGARRQPLCGMGVCGECRVAIDGKAHRLGCQTPCAAGMQVRTDA